MLIIFNAFNRIHFIPEFESNPNTLIPIQSEVSKDSYPNESEVDVYKSDSFGLVSDSIGFIQFDVVFIQFRILKRLTY